VPGVGKFHLLLGRDMMCPDHDAGLVDSFSGGMLSWQSDERIARCLEIALPERTGNAGKGKVRGSSLSAGRGGRNMSEVKGRFLALLR
jgi:hypothetical protein